MSTLPKISESEWEIMKLIWKSGWLNYNGKWFYLDKQGAMVANTTLEIDGKQYEFSSTGKLMGR